MVCKRAEKMNLNAAFVHNYPCVHTYFIAIFFIILNLSIPQSRLGTSWHYGCTGRRIKDFPFSPLKGKALPTLKFARVGLARIRIHCRSLAPCRNKSFVKKFATFRRVAGPIHAPHFSLSLHEFLRKLLLPTHGIRPPGSVASNTD